MQIFVRTLDGKINISVVVGPNDTVGNVKAKIEDQTGFSVEEQQLFFGGAPVEDHKTLQYLSIQSNSTLHLVLRAIEKVIYVKTLTGQTITIPVESNTTVCQLEDMVTEKIGVDPSQLRFIFAGTIINHTMDPLRYSHTLRDRNIRYGCTLHTVLSLPGGGGIPIKNTSTGETIWMSPDIDTIRDLKAEIQKVTGIPAREQHLCFDDKELENHRALKEFFRSGKPFGEFTLRRSP